ncbi:MAG TPA: uroporphyrinogen decarboxylase family protein [Armatimonadota bacterium]
MEAMRASEMTPRQRFLAAIHGNPLDRVPVFPLLMFLPADRAGISYRTYATEGSAMADAQLLVQQRFGLDAISACSDAFRLAADLGGDMAFPEDNPPFLQQPLLSSANELSRLVRPDPMMSGGRMHDRVRAVEQMVRGVAGRVAVLGWVDLPFAEACSLCGITEFMMLLVDDPDGAHRILRFLTDLVIDFALAQVAAGADMVGAGDAAASLLSLPMYEEFALPYEQEVCNAIHAAHSLMKLHICGDTTRLLSALVRVDADLYNVDHLVPFAQAVAIYGAAGKCFKGNLDPVSEMMQVTPEACAATAHERLLAARGKRYILSAGCEVPAATPDAVLQAFCAATTAATSAR